MKAQILILALLIGKAVFTNLPICSCSNHKSQTYCNEDLKCTWTNGTCSDVKDPCSLVTTQTICDTIDGCAWTDKSTCALFTQCSDYHIQSSSNAEQCYLKDDTCVPGTIIQGQSVTCKTGSVVCSDVQDTKICSGLFQNDGKWCAATNNKCVAQDVSSCTTMTNYGYCLSLGCGWLEDSSKCIAPPCFIHEKESECDSVRTNSLGMAQLCVWCNGKCTEAVNKQKSTDYACVYASTEGYIYTSGVTYTETLDCSYAFSYLLLSFIVMILLGL